MLELSVATREDHLSRMAGGTLDVLVIGGGITGAGAALDAASRGLTVGLVEKGDFASGTSGRSSRMIHGGLRYLRYGALGLVYESLRERELLRRLAPHLVRPLPFFLPVSKARHRVPLTAALSVYDALTFGRGIHRHRRVGPEEGARLAPGLGKRSGGLVSYDCRTDDARLTVEILRQAVGHGALVANHAEVRGLLGEGTVGGARVADVTSGSEVEIRARVVVNATGVWADRVHGLAAPKPSRLRPSKGIHIVFDRARVPINSGMYLPSVAEPGTFILMIPWGPRVYAGTTDTAYAGALEEPTVDGSDTEAILASVDRAFGPGLTEGDIVASWAGVRPLLDTGKGPTRDLSRRHIVYEDPPGLITATGGKLTTYRLMAEDVVNDVCRKLGRGGKARTRSIPLGLTTPLDRELDRAASGATAIGLSSDVGRRLVALYGDDWDDALTLIRDDPSLAEPVAKGLPVRGVEVRLARTREMALTDDDVLIRRTRLTTMDTRAAERVTLPA